MKEGTFKFRDRKLLAEKNLEEKRKKEEENRERKSKINERESSNLLVVENIPSKATEEMLFDLFGQYPGCK